MEGSSLPVGGSSTHSVLAGHTGLPSANLFTDLDQLKNGDMFYIHALDKVLAYKVDQIKKVLPYEIDEEKSELNGGLYDSLSKTITWEDSFDILSSAMVTKNYNYRIRLMYKDIDSSVDIINNVEGTVILEDRTITRSTNYSTAITIPGTIKVKYVDIESGEEIEEEVKSVNIINNKYYPASKYIDGYYLVETPELTSYTFDEEEQTIYYKYKKIVTREEKVEPSQNKIDENPQTGIFDYISYTIMTVITIIGITITLNIRKKKIFRRV
jgi:hypothetical protein